MSLIDFLFDEFLWFVVDYNILVGELLKWDVFFSISVLLLFLFWDMDMVLFSVFLDLDF